MSRVWFTADHHFGHASSIGMCARPFAGVSEMDAVMIQRWNETVAPDDVVWHLGDFAYRSARPPEQIFDQLHGQKHLIVGNHDSERTRAMAWASVQQMKEVAVDGHRIFLCHYPVLEWPAFWRQSIHLFGHVHGNRDGVGRSLDVGVDVWDFRPVGLSSILEKLRGVMNE